jgi:two-component system sensor histidine kinase SenX3
LDVRLFLRLDTSSRAGLLSRGTIQPSPMKISGRRKTMAFFIVLGSCLVALAVALQVGWIILNWRETVLLFFGVIFFALLIAGVVINTTFLVREIRLNEQHDSFVNAVTHELKTPIASIRLYLETMQRRELDEKQRQKFYRLMLHDTDRLLGTVNQVLKAGEARHKSHKPQKVELDFGELVRESIELAKSRHHLDAGAMRYEESSIGTPFKVNGDAEDLRPAVSNLLDNAIKYSGDNVDVSVSLEPAVEKKLKLNIRDRGVGIPADELKRIFRRFYRVRNRALAKVKGTGLGLFIVRAIAKTHDGRVYAESAGEGLGTTVTLELPRSNA